MIEFTGKPSTPGVLWVITLFDIWKLFNRVGIIHVISSWGNFRSLCLRIYPFHLSGGTDIKLFITFSYHPLISVVILLLSLSILIICILFLLICLVRGLSILWMFKKKKKQERKEKKNSFCFHQFLGFHFSDFKFYFLAPAWI